MIETSYEIDFCTLGMFILDDIYPRKTDLDQSPKLNVIGGAGTYSTIGARLFCPPPASRTVGWIVDAGTDFPNHVSQIISSWDTSLLLRDRQALTTRGWNAYTEDEHRAFKYLTEKKRITAEDLPPTLLRSSSFHLICSASRCSDLVGEILRRRAALGSPSRPIFVWEPVPDLCTSVEIEAIRAALREVDSISPNHEELATLFDTRHPAGTIDKGMIEEQATALLDFGIGPNGEGSVVVRSGKLGAYAITKAEKFWLPAYHADQKKVVDPTGGGNGFLGGLALGLARRSSIRQAVSMGCVAASFCIEQVGLPELTPTSDGRGELWNGVSVSERLELFEERDEAI